MIKVTMTIMAGFTIVVGEPLVAVKEMTNGQMSTDWPIKMDLQDNSVLQDVSRYHLGNFGRLDMLPATGLCHAT